VALVSEKLLLSRLGLTPHRRQRREQKKRVAALV
jgi:hypothetical protein